MRPESHYRIIIVFCTYTKDAIDEAALELFKKDRV